MGITYGMLTVFFEDPFWVGVFERVSDGKLSACRVVFGAEPKDQEVWDFVLNRYNDLKFTPEVHAKVRQTADSPKARQRRAKNQLQRPGVGTKSQQALKLQRENQKTERTQLNRQLNQAEKRRRFSLKQQKRKQKHRGR